MRARHLADTYSANIASVVYRGVRLIIPMPLYTFAKLLVLLTFVMVMVMTIHGPRRYWYGLMLLVGVLLFRQR